MSCPAAGLGTRIPGSTIGTWGRMRVKKGERKGEKRRKKENEKKDKDLHIDDSQQSFD